MDIRRILADLRRERDRIDNAIAAIESLNSTGRAYGDHGPRGGVTAPPIRRRRRLSAAARKRLSALLKARWAAGKMGKHKSKAKH